MLFAIDRAGLVGEDGPTHAGSFDLSYLRCIPNMLVMAPSDENEARLLLSTGYHHGGPAAVRYPRGKATGCVIDAGLQMLPIGKAHKVRDGRDVALLVFGTLLGAAREVAAILDATLVDMRFVKPLDEAMITELAASHRLLVTIEENVISGGAGSGVNELLQRLGSSAHVLNLGLPDRFLDHGRPQELLSACGLDTRGILASVQEHLTHLS